MAARVVAETLGRGAARVGEAQRKGLSYLADVSDGAALARLRTRRRATPSGTRSAIEKAALRSASVLFSDPADADKKLAAMAATFDQRAAALYNEINAFYRLQAESPESAGRRAGSHAARTARRAARAGARWRRPRRAGRRAARGPAPPAGAPPRRRHRSQPRQWVEAAAGVAREMRPWHSSRRRSGRPSRPPCGRFRAT